MYRSSLIASVHMLVRQETTQHGKKQNERMDISNVLWLWVIANGTYLILIRLKAFVRNAISCKCQCLSWACCIHFHKAKTKIYFLHLSRVRCMIFSSSGRVSACKRMSSMNHTISGIPSKMREQQESNSSKEMLRPMGICKQYMQLFSVKKLQFFWDSFLSATQK